MKSFVKSITLAALVAVPAVSFAQASNGPVTRAQVREELVQLEHAGYYPGTDNNINYPADIQAAEARVAAENGQATGVGGVAGGSSAAGGPASMTPAPMAPADTGNRGSVYFGQ